VVGVVVVEVVVEAQGVQVEAQGVQHEAQGVQHEAQGVQHEAQGVIGEVVQGVHPLHPVMVGQDHPAGSIPTVYRDRLTATLPEALHQDPYVIHQPFFGGATQIHTTGTDSPTHMLIIFERTKEFA